jgi:hypothetical protein
MPVTLQLTGHHKDLGGGFVVRRLLPSAARQAVGPFLFFDHFGPVTEEPGLNRDVRPHPHIGLATVTYLFEGAIMHRDNLGSVQEITPGAINWMTAGHGIVHSERRPERLQNVQYVNHGIQLWVALPQAHEATAPSFIHTPAGDIPEVDLPGTVVRVLVGSAFGQTSPVAPLAPTLYLELRLEPGAQLALPALADEMAIYTVDTALQVDGQLVAAQTLAVLEPGQPVQLSSPTGGRCVVLGGAPQGYRHIWWNFVASDNTLIDDAVERWHRMDAATGMGQVQGETEFIPVPNRPARKPGA